MDIFFACYIDDCGIFKKFYSTTEGLVETKELAEEYYRNQFVDDLAIKQLHLYEKQYGSETIYSKLCIISLSNLVLCIMLL